MIFHISTTVGASGADIHWETGGASIEIYVFAIRENRVIAVMKNFNWTIRCMKFLADP
ncbi:hypothetical protein [Burkholderia contaminans]|uniref:hypothetical protein n=1 Tax=Burkholderia contaminans TaxID=488447 RepID=UPI0015A71FC1|nr:hypothetical protein [Burkholderia contaminans]